MAKVRNRSSIRPFVWQNIVYESSRPTQRNLLLLLTSHISIARLAVATGLRRRRLEALLEIADDVVDVLRSD